MSSDFRFVFNVCDKLASSFFLCCFLNEIVMHACVLFIYLLTIDVFASVYLFVLLLFIVSHAIDQKAAEFIFHNLSALDAVGVSLAAFQCWESYFRYLCRFLFLLTFCCCCFLFLCACVCVSVQNRWSQRDRSVLFRPVF